MPKPTGPHHPIVRAPRIGLCGGTVLEPENAAFASALGEELAPEEGLVLVTGGFKCLADNPQIPSSDWSYIKGARHRLLRENIPIDRKVETLLPDPGQDRAKIVRFREGAIVALVGRTLQSRRFKLVGSVDTLVVVEGAKATLEIIDLALALERPVLPLPFTGGAALQRWSENSKLIREWFEIDSTTAHRWETISLAGMSQDDIVALAKAVKRHLLHQLRRKCFIMMPFKPEFLPLYEYVIKPVAEGAGLLPVRTDQIGLVGDIVDALHSVIRLSACCIAVITEFNPSVMYELGLAHAQGKPVVLLCERLKDSMVLPELPYDLRHESVIGYTAGEWDSLSATIRGVLGQLRGR